MAEVNLRKILIPGNIWDFISAQKKLVSRVIEICDWSDEFVPFFLQIYIFFFEKGKILVGDDGNSAGFMLEGESL